MEKRIVHNSEEYIMLSGIQHFTFCKRQWALIHVEQQWAENQKTIEGNIVHEKADQPFSREKRGDLVIVRAMPIQSHILGVNGICDVVEFKKDSEGVFIPSLNNRYKIHPIEYKRGKPKNNKADILQLVAQAICLEEMLVCTIDKGYLFYNETKQRQLIEITKDLRNEVIEIFIVMHNMFQKKHTPKVKTGSWCNQCSLNDICLPKIMNVETASRYMERMLNE
ncbi:CRISPR-associated protein Cas4 [Fundicoccus culcitae]|uniref:CRISPR-associated exonuclease Cas4 n=1 Tax=Fundicoccus culcitae TaxID=2969821 RepID=A0ABY5P2D0_9LACT|nr:CRISPR-associated protein Cas4 [Fundicoccus culcitae]UUX32770.1 CRISPR-associated protein Cas4 [Fundicoccus culcitae]